MKAVRTYQGTVYSWDCDHMNHMNVKFYVGKFDQATWNLLALLGLDSVYFKSEKKGMVALEQHIRYIKEVMEGDNIYVESEIISVKEKVIHFKHIMYNLHDKALCAETEITGLHIDTEKRKSVLLPDFVIENLKKL